MGQANEFDRRDLGAIAAGNVSRFWGIWDRHRATVESACRRRLTASTVDWRDAAQETLVRAWHTMPDHATEISDARGWLLHLARWVCADHLRAMRRQASLNEDKLRSAASFDVDSDPEIVLARTWEAREALRKIDALPRHLRQVCVAYYVDEESLSAIAQDLNTTERAVRAALRRARDLLNGGMTDAANCALATVARAVRHMRVVTVRRADGLQVDHRADLEGPLSRRSIRVRTLRRHVAQYPTGWKRRLELANLLFAAGDLDEAIVHLRAVALKVPARLDVVVRLAEALELAGRCDEAVRAYDGAADMAREPAQAARLRGLRARLMGDDARAVAELTRAAAHAPGDASIWHTLGDTQERMHRYAEAVAAFDRAIEIDPDDTVALVRSHNGLCAMGRYPEMLRRLERAIKIDPNNAVALKLLAAHRAARSMVHGAEGVLTRQLIDRALRLAPEAADAWETLANYLVRRGEWVRARAVLREYVNRHPGSARGWFHLAMWQLNTGRPRDALSSAREAVRLSPDWFEPYWLYVNVSVLLRERNGLADTVQAMLVRFPALWDAHTSAGYALTLFQSEAERAFAVAHQGVQLAPTVCAAWCRYAEVLEALQRWDDAAEALEQAWSLLAAASVRCGAGIAVRLCRACRLMGDASRAHQWASTALRLAADLAHDEPAEGLFVLAQASQAAGNDDDAKRLFGALLHSRPVWPVRRAAMRALRDLRC